MTENISLNGKTVLITGGTSGIGKAAALSLAKEGAIVTIFGRHQQKIDDSIRDIKQAGSDAKGFVADVSNIEQIQLVFNYIDEQYGKLDILINNAAEPSRSIVDTSTDKIKYNLEVNLLGYIYCAKFAIERMAKQKSGHIINIGSLSAVTLDAGTDLYVASKSGVKGFNESLRKGINAYNIKTTLIEPGAVATGMAKESEEKKKRFQEELLMLNPNDVAEAISFALTRPKRCEIITIQLKPFKQNI